MGNANRFEVELRERQRLVIGDYLSLFIVKFHYDVTEEMWQRLHPHMPRERKAALLSGHTPAQVHLRLTAPSHHLVRLGLDYRPEKPGEEKRGSPTLGFREQGGIRAVGFATVRITKILADCVRFEVTFEPGQSAEHFVDDDQKIEAAKIKWSGPGNPSPEPKPTRPFPSRPQRRWQPPDRRR